MQVLIVKPPQWGRTAYAARPDRRAAGHSRYPLRLGGGRRFQPNPDRHPAVDRVIPVAIRRWRKNWFGNDTRQQRCDFKRALQERRYDVVIDAQGLIKAPR